MGSITYEGLAFSSLLGERDIAEAEIGHDVWQPRQPTIACGLQRQQKNYGKEHKTPGHQTHGTPQKACDVTRPIVWMDTVMASATHPLRGILRILCG